MRTLSAKQYVNTQVFTIHAKVYSLQLVFVKSLFLKGKIYFQKSTKEVLPSHDEGGKVGEVREFI